MKNLNYHNLKFSDLKNLRVIDKTKIKEPLFHRNNVTSTWMIAETTVKSKQDIMYGTYNEYQIQVSDDYEISVSCNTYGGMSGYVFEEFFNTADISCKIDLEIQKKLIGKINFLIDNDIFEVVR